MSDRLSVASRWLVAGAGVLALAAAIGVVLIVGDDDTPVEPAADEPASVSPLPDVPTPTDPPEAEEASLPSLEAGVCSVPAGQASVARVWNEQLLEAIRRDEPAPTVHSRNLYHLSAAMWDAWAAFDTSATALFHDVEVRADDVAAARTDALSYAAVTVLTSRYRGAVGGPETLRALDETMLALCGVTVATAHARLASGSAAELGVIIAESVLAANAEDGSNEEANYQDASYAPVNPPLEVAFPGTEMVDPNRWQPLDLEIAFTQNDLPAPGSQTFIGSQWGSVTTFALPVGGRSGIPLDPGEPPMLGSPDSDGQFRAGVVDVLEASRELAVGEATIDISPRAKGNNTLGADDGVGHDVNPATGLPYSANVVDRADYLRAIAEFWADGPDSETPPGHWNALANRVSDSLPPSRLRVGGVGQVVDRLEWDVKLYLVLNGAMHDAAIAAWGAKAFYDYARPISMIRYMGGLGQSSNPELASYDPSGLPLVPGLIELVTEENSAPGERHQTRRNRVGEVFVLAWRGPPPDPEADLSGVDWIRSVAWVPYQRPTFVTPAFAAYVSGHSAFSRAGADVLAAFTGSAYFPGGLGEYTVSQGSLVHEQGPTEDVTLQWATYADAADEAGISRIYGGIHVPADDFAGRTMGADCARFAWEMGLGLF